MHYAFTHILKFGVIPIAGWLLSISTVNANTALDLRKSMDQTLQNNTELKKYPFSLRQEQALERQANIGPSPQLSLELEDLYGSKQYDDFGQTEITLIFSQTIEMGSKRQQRLATSQAAQDRIKLEYELAKTDILAETGRRYYEVLRVQNLQTILHQKIERETQALARIQKLAKSGAADPVDMASMSLLLKRSQSEYIRLEHEHKIAKTRLAAMWMGQGEFKKVTGHLDQLPLLPTQTQLLTAIENSPAILHKMALLREADQRVKSEVSLGTNDIRYGIGLRHKQADNAQTLNFGISVPLSFSNPNQGRIEAAQAELQANQYENETAKTHLQLTLIERLQRLQQYKMQAEQLKQHTLPEAEILIKTSLASYKRGTTDILQVIQAQDTWFDMQQELIEISIRVYLELLELERLTGEPLSKPQITENSNHGH